jgi:beta-phosphoglucomutase-like phosphatase (HAD superfamily)
MTPMSDGTLARRTSIHYNPDVSVSFTSYKLGRSEVEVAITDDSPFEDEEAETERLVDMSVRILPGVRALIDSLPEGKYAVATSGAKTYCHGCLTRTK